MAFWSLARLFSLELEGDKTRSLASMLMSRLKFALPGYPLDRRISLGERFTGELPARINRDIGKESIGIRAERTPGFISVLWPCMRDF
jgi:hypothetical protein